MKKAYTIGVIVMGILSRLFGAEKEEFPPIPKWAPSIPAPIDLIADRFAYYTDHKRDFVVFSNGTCVLVADGLSDAEATKEAKEVIAKIFNYHPDMNPLPMDDGNILVQYNHPAVNVVLSEIVSNNWKEIQTRHLDALTKSEVMITPLGPNKFDDFGMKALFGRCYFFMDAKHPHVTKIVRKSTDIEHVPPGGRCEAPRP